MTTATTSRLLRLSEVQARSGLSRSTLYRKMREGSFPEPLKVGGRAVRWPEHEINDWLETRPRARGHTRAVTLRERP